MTLRYSADTSAIIGAWRRRMPPDVFPSFWVKLDALIQHGDLACNEEVRREIRRKDDEIKAWLDARDHCVHETTAEIWAAAQEITRVFPMLAKAGTTKSEGDPFVIAFARVHGLTVITDEGIGTGNVVKIPNVCNALQIKWVDLYGLARAEGWRF